MAALLPGRPRGDPLPLAPSATPAVRAAALTEPGKRPAAESLPGARPVLRAHRRPRGPSPGDGELQHQRIPGESAGLLLRIPQRSGFWLEGVRKRPGLGPWLRAGVCSEFHGVHMRLRKWAPRTCLVCCSLKSITIATAPSHGVHSCCLGDKEHILRQRILNGDVLKCRF